MSTLTVAQAIERKRALLNVPGFGETIRCVVYFPFDEVSSRRFFNLGREALEGGTATQEKFDFVSTTTTRTGENDQLVLMPSDNLTKSIDIQSNRSFLVMYVFNGAALATWNEFTIGAVGVNESEISMVPGAVQIDHDSGNTKTFSYTTGSVASAKYGLLLLYDKVSDTYTVYEGGEGEAFTSKDSASKHAGAVAFANPCPIIFNNTLGSIAHGAVVLEVVDAGTSFPSDILTSCATMRDNWMNGVSGLVY